MCPGRGRALLAAGLLQVAFAGLGLSVVVPRACQEREKTDYHLFGTRTMYKVAQTFIEKEDGIPKSFSNETLAEEHKELLANSCKPVVFYFVGRHAARFPEGDDIEIYNERMNWLRSQLQLSRISRSCPDKFAGFLSWTSKMDLKQDNLITGLGAREERDIARRLKRLYPDFFDTTKANIKLGVTDKLRTAQTSAEFLKEVDGISRLLPFCGNLEDLPTSDPREPGYSVQKLTDNACYKSMNAKYAVSMLEFHLECKKLAGKGPKVRDALVERVKSPAVLGELGRRIGERLGLDQPLGAETVDVIYDVCKFEMAIQGHSVWCSLFDSGDLQVFEYIDDVSNYIKDAYGPRANNKQSCPLMKDIVRAVRAAPHAPKDERPRSYFYFTHASPMKKLFGSLGVFKDDENYDERHVSEFVNEHKLEKERDWRSSLAVPFSANMAFVVYRCQKDSLVRSLAGSKGQVEYKVMSIVNERPVKIAGCKETKCPLEDFLAAHEQALACNLRDICTEQPAGGDTPSTSQSGQRRSDDVAGSGSLHSPGVFETFVH